MYKLAEFRKKLEKKNRYSFIELDKSPELVATTFRNEHTQTDYEHYHNPEKLHALSVNVSMLGLIDCYYDIRGFVNSVEDAIILKFELNRKRKAFRDSIEPIRGMMERVNEIHNA